MAGWGWGATVTIFLIVSSVVALETNGRGVCTLQRCLPGSLRTGRHLAIGNNKRGESNMLTSMRLRGGNPSPAPFIPAPLYRYRFIGCWVSDLLGLSRNFRNQILPMMLHPFKLVSLLGHAFVRWRRAAPPLPGPGAYQGMVCLVMGGSGGIGSEPLPFSFLVPSPFPSTLHSSLLSRAQCLSIPGPFTLPPSPLRYQVAKRLASGGARVLITSRSEASGVEAALNIKR